MPFMSVDKSVHVKATPQNCILAFKEAISTLDKYSIRCENTSTNTIEVDKKLSFTRGGNGENVSFSAKPVGSGCDILITVSSKGLPYLLWQRNCEKVAQDTLSAFSEKIQSYLTNEQDEKSVFLSAADEIKKYKELLDIGAISPDEYEAKKKQLLAL